jgi:hypothetical protein
MVTGAQLLKNRVKQDKKNYVAISMDIKNAHNTFDKAKASLTVQQAAQKVRSSY